MALSGSVREAQHHDRGFDSNGKHNKLTRTIAKAFRAANFQFCLRYLPRVEPDAKHDYDLSAEEADMILDVGLGLLAVQHVESEKAWTPTPQKGREYGQFAVHWARDVVGLPSGVSVFLDLEAVKSGTPKPDILEYCLNWKKEVVGGGFSPGLYTGDAMHLNGKDVGTLAFNHYWLAYTENFPIPDRAFQMQQFSLDKHPEFRPAGVGGFDFQADIAMKEPGHGSVKFVAR